MNEEPPTPFDTVGDAPVEARIVAWVLGEASAFEAAELERLCDERPELLVFRRRMRALHGLLTEAEAGEKDHSWKLPAEKREVLDEIFGEEKVARLEPKNEHRIRRAGFRAFLAIAACVVLTIIVAKLIGPISPIGPMKSAVTTNPAVPPSAPSEFAQRELAKAVRDQEDKVEERRKVLATITRTKGIIYKGQDSFYGQSGVDEDQGARIALQTYNQLEQEKLQKESQIKSLSKYDGDQLMTYASILDSPDNIVKDLQPQYAEAKRKLESAKINGLGEDHPSVKAAAEQVQATKRQMDEGVVNLKATLQAQLAMTEDRLKKVEVMKDDSREEAIKRGLDAQDYADAKRDFESDQQLLQALKLKQIEQTIAKNVRDETLARNDAPAPTSAPATPPSAGTYRLESRQSQTKTGAGVLEFKEQSMLAKRSAKPASEVAAAEATAEIELPAPAASPAMPQLPAIAASGMSAGLGDREKNFPRERGMIVDASEAPAADAAALAAATGGSRSASGPIGGNNIDAILNPPSQPAPRRSGARGKDGSAAKPPVLAGKEVWAGAKDAGEAPVRTNAARTSGRAETNEKTRKTLYMAEGNLNLKKHDEAKKHYQEALKADPGNSAARLGLEKAEAAKSDYHRAANDHTRAELLSQVDSTWELTVPGASTASGDVAKIEIIREFQYPTEYELPEPANEPLPEEEAKLLADLANEIPAAETPYSTFSLNISDASFQLAKAALAKGERPEPASIKPEQFYNAVDYGDPAPASNEPVAATIEQSAHPVIPGRNLVRVALRTGSVGRSAVQPLRLTLLVDQSGSMVREDRRASMEHALSQLGVLLTKADLVTVIGFSRTPHLLADGMTGDQSLKLSELVNQTASEGGTNLEEAMKLGGQLAERHQLAGAQNRIVLFTDGAANLGDANPARLAGQVKAFRQKGLAFDIAGIGADGLNDRLLSELARNGNGRYYVVGDEKNDSFARQLAGAFRPAAENVKVQVNFNPQRVGKYKLIGFEKDRLKTEDFRNDAVDAAELAAEEAGVAIYQVEPLADGTGEIGEVSVRFRDAAGKEMVERTWTISYDSQATAFDRATPSMQLAGLSLLAAEKLKGGPLADAIDFKQLTGPTSLVKQFYGNSSRVSDMLRVIDELK